MNFLTGIKSTSEANLFILLPMSSTQSDPKPIGVTTPESTEDLNGKILDDSRKIKKPRDQRTQLERIIESIAKDHGYDVEAENGKLLINTTYKIINNTLNLTLGPHSNGEHTATLLNDVHSANARFLAAQLTENSANEHAIVINALLKTSLTKKPPARKPKDPLNPKKKIDKKSSCDKKETAVDESMDCSLPLSPSTPIDEELSTQTTKPVEVTQG